MADVYTGITVFGLYDNVTESPLFGAVGSTAPTSALAIAGTDGTNLQLISVDNTGRVNVNATITPPSDNKVGPVVINGDGSGTQTYSISTEGTSALTVQVVAAGGFDGTVIFQASLDGSTYVPFLIYPVLPDGTPAVSQTSTSGKWQAPVGGFRNFRVIQTTPGTTGTATIYLTAGQGQYSVLALSDQYANFLATSKITDGTNTATVTAAGAVKVDGSAVTQPVSGTVTANQGTPNTNANGWPVKITDGTNVLGTNANPVRVDPTGTTTQPVSGTVTANQGTSPWIVAGNKTNNNAAPNGTNIGVLPAIANAASPTWTEGNAVLLSTDLSGSLRVSATAPSDRTSTGTITSNQNVAISAQGASTIGWNVTGTWTGTLVFEVSQDGTNWVAVDSFSYTPQTASATSTTANGQWHIPAGGYNMFRVRGNTVATGTATVFIEASTGANTLYVKNFVGGDLQVTAQQGTSPWVENLTQVGGSAITLGQKTSANSFPVVIASDQSSFPVTVSGTVAVTQSTTPWVVNLTQWNSVAVGSPTAWGTAPTGNVIGVNAELFAGNTALSATSTSLNVNVTNATVSVAGTLTNNNAAPAANNVGVLPAVATNAPLTYTNGNQVLQTTSLGGAVRVVPVDEENASSISYFSVDTGNTLKTVTTGVVFPLVSIQANSAAFIFRVREVSGFTDGTGELIQLIKNPQTLTGSAFTTTGIPSGSHIKIDTSATAVTIGTGTVVWSGYAASVPAMINTLMSSLAAGTPGDTYTVACQKFGTGTSKAGGQIHWSEQAAAL